MSGLAVLAPPRPPRPGRTRANDPERVRADILDIATAHFSACGLSGGRVDEIAEATRTSKRMIYYYFGSKEGLYRAVLARCYAGIRAHEAELDLAALPPAEALARLAGATFDYHDANPDFVRIVMVENIHRGQHIGSVPGIEARGPGATAQLAALIDRGVATGVFRVGLDPLDLHLTINGLSFYNVSNRATIGAIFGRDLSDAAVRAARRGVVVDTVMRWAAA